MSPHRPVAKVVVKSGPGRELAQGLVAEVRLQVDQANDAACADEAHRIGAEVLENELEHLEARAADVRQALQFHRREQAAERMAVGSAAWRITVLLGDLEGLPELEAVAGLSVSGSRVTSLGGLRCLVADGYSDEALRESLSGSPALARP